MKITCTELTYLSSTTIYEHDLTLVTVESKIFQCSLTFLYFYQMFFCCHCYDDGMYAQKQHNLLYCTLSIEEVYVLGHTGD